MCGGGENGRAIASNHLLVIGVHTHVCKSIDSQNEHANLNLNLFSSLILNGFSAVNLS